jgi:hypothetical protein
MQEDRVKSVTIRKKNEVFINAVLHHEVTQFFLNESGGEKRMAIVTELLILAEIDM